MRIRSLFHAGAIVGVEAGVDTVVGALVHEVAPTKVIVGKVHFFNMLKSITMCVVNTIIPRSFCVSHTGSRSRSRSRHRDRHRSR